MGFILIPGFLEVFYFVLVVFLLYLISLIINNFVVGSAFQIANKEDVGNTVSEMEHNI